MEERFHKNRISCSFAAAERVCTIGFTNTKLTKPQTVLKGYQLQSEIEVDFILSRDKGKKDFQTVVYNALDMKLEECMELIKCGCSTNPVGEKSPTGFFTCKKEKSRL